MIELKDSKEDSKSANIVGDWEIVKKGIGNRIMLFHDLDGCEFQWGVDALDSLFHYQNKSVHICPGCGS